MKEMSIFGHFLADFKFHPEFIFFSKKFFFSSIFIFSPRNEFCFKIYNFFFSESWHLILYDWRNRLVNEQIYTCEQKIHFLLSKSKIGASQFALGRNAISTLESKKTARFWSRTTLVYIHNSYSKASSRDSWTKKLLALRWHVYWILMSD